MTSAQEPKNSDTITSTDFPGLKLFRRGDRKSGV